MFIITDEWRRMFPEAAVGFLALNGVSNPEQNPALEERRSMLERGLRARFLGQDRTALENLVTMRAYQTYYKRFKKTYHVLLQLESLVYKDKSIPSAAALVEAMFMAELQNGLLTAGHDLDQLDLPVTVGTSTGSERYLVMRGEEQLLKPGDMFMADQQGVISSILYGPDYRTRINPETKSVMFAVYAPAGIGEGLVYEHLRAIQENVRLFSPDACVDRLEIFTS